MVLSGVISRITIALTITHITGLITPLITITNLQVHRVVGYRFLARKPDSNRQAKTRISMLNQAPGALCWAAPRRLQDVDMPLLEPTYYTYYFGNSRANYT